MKKVSEVLLSLKNALMADSSQFQPAFAVRGEVFELVRRDLSNKKLLVDNYVSIWDKYRSIIGHIDDNSDADQYCKVLNELIDLLDYASENQDYYCSVDNLEGTWKLSEDFPRESEKIIDLRYEYDRFMGMLKRGENFVLTRSGDGEIGIILGREFKAQEGWEAPGRETKLGRDLLESYSLCGENVYHGVSCPCCDPSAFMWYVQHVKDPTHITFSNLWVNSNYSRFIEDFETLSRDAIVIANYNSRGKKYGNLNILDYYTVSDDCISFWENEAKELLDRVNADYGKRDGILYLISCGPMSNPMIAELYKNNPNNCYIDFGSCIDTYTYDGRMTRPYMKPETHYARKRCWMPNPKTLKRPNITAVMTLYKRPNMLLKQLEAIEKQTIKPCEILLFQDHIENSGYIVTLDEGTKKRFADVHICSKNVGVWDRFDYAYNKANGEYVCIFDDDTIPGNRWFENCYIHMLQKEGIYVTLGIEMDKETEYPCKGGFYRVGWDNPNQESIEVDFGGHAWFVKKEYLKCMADKDLEFKKNNKYVGEDVWLSYKNLKDSDVHTIVPEHVDFALNFWGSIPQIAYQAGTDSCAISLDEENGKNKHEIIKALEQTGWNRVSVRCQDYYLIKFKELNGRT